VLAFLRETRTRLLDRAVGLGDILTLGANSDAARPHFLRRGCHGEHDGGCIESEKLSFVAISFHLALACRLVIGDKQTHSG
jgi:hypothetical protein